MLTYYSADYILPATSGAIKDGIIGIDSDNVIRAILNSTNVLDEKVIPLKGVLIPGMVNAHCHLELSYLRNRIPKHTGLPEFILAVMQNRDEKEDFVYQSMVEADQQMYDNGIQAVGDHVNTAVSAEIKNKSKIRYHTFVEIIGLDPNKAQEKIDSAREIEFHFDHKRASITPHAFYSCSKELVKKFKKSVANDNILSIHNQESEEENRLFRYKTGDFLDFYSKIKFDSDLLKPQGKSSLQASLPFLPQQNPLIFVHNTNTSIKDLSFVERTNREIVFCFCPKANLYIENQLPKVMLFQYNNKKIAIGTDSLASNDSLNVLEELKVLHRAFPELSFLDTIKWITINGAEALQLDEELGSIEIGKAPGLILLKDMEDFVLDDNVSIERIV